MGKGRLRQIYCDHLRWEPRNCSDRIETCINALLTTGVVSRESRTIVLRIGQEKTSKSKESKKNGSITKRRGREGMLNRFT